MKLKYEFAITELSGQTVAIPVGDNADELHGMLRMNGTAASVLKLLQEETGETELIEKIALEYETSPEKIAGDIKELIQKFDEAGLLQ